MKKANYIKKVTFLSFLEAENLYFKKAKIKYIILLFVFTVLQSCSIKKYIPEDEKLYTGATINMQIDTVIFNEEDLQNTLEKVLRPKPNTKILGSYLGLYYHYKTQNNKGSFITKWLNKKFGEKPVYESNVERTENEDILRNRLENYGFFYSAINSDFKEEEKTAKAIYNLKVPAPYSMETYQLDTIIYPIYKDIKEVSDKNSFEKGMRFDLGKLKLERKRLDAVLNKKGYYNFNEDFLIFEADTNQYKNKKFDLFLKLKANVPSKAIIPYKVKKINIYPNYNLKDTINLAETRFNKKSYFQDTIFFKPKRLDNFITLKEDEYYNPDESKNTARRLSSIGAYKFVNIQYKVLDTIANDSLGLLEADIFLSPLTKRAIRTELQAVTKSNNFAGPTIATTFSNRNLFNGGEILNLSASLGYETQVSSGDNAGLSSLELELKSELIFPRVIAPFTFNQNFFKYAIPKTKMSLSAAYLDRSNLYTLVSGTALYGYVWNANKYVTIEINPISVNYTRLSDTTTAFDEILSENSFLASSFEQEFISGLTFSYTYNEMLDTNKTHQFYLESTIDVAGNSIGLLGKESNKGNFKEFLGLQYAQYAKVDVDARYHYNFGDNNEKTLAARLFGGYGYAYGNSDVVPFSKQYYAGGPYSVRAFQIRSLGPGTFSQKNNNATNFFDKTGNIRLEANLEYRFPLYGFFKGAFFVDAGNVWNSVASPDFNGQDKFSSNFINELGIGGGFGMRIDVQNFVIRFDLAAPFHDPALSEGSRWDFRWDEPVFNFAIGYSF